MGYRRVTVELLYQIHVRLRAGDSHRMIAAALGLEKKTVNQYAQRMLAINIPAATDYVAALARLAALLPANKKPQPAFEVLRPYAEEIHNLITGNKAECRKACKQKAPGLSSADAMRFQNARATKHSNALSARVRSLRLHLPRFLESR